MNERRGGKREGIPKSYLSSNCNEIYTYILKIKTKFAIRISF